MRVLIANTHSALNSGDLAITLAEVQLIQRNRAFESVTVTSRTPTIDKDFLAPLGVAALHPIIPAPSVFDGTLKKVIHTVENLVAVTSKAVLIREMNRCDLVIGSGGGYFWSNRRRFPGPMFFQNYLHLLLPCLLKKPVVLFPQSIGPFYNPTVTRLLGTLLNHENVISVLTREDLSYNVARGLLKERNRPKVDRCPDMAFCLERTSEHGFEAIPHLPRPIIGVTVRQWDFPDLPTRKEKKQKQDDYLGALVRACHRVCEEWGGSVMVFAQARGPGAFEDDRAISNEVVKRLKEVLPPDRVAGIHLNDAVSPAQLIDLLSHADLLIATRFHSAIFAFLAGIPAIAIAYQPKSTGIMSSLGLERFSVDIRAVNSEIIRQLAGEILGHYQETRSNLIERVEQLRLTAREKLETALAAPWAR